MPIRVVSCYTYRTSVDSFWTDAHHSVNQFVAAIKERRVNGYGHVLVSGTVPLRRISDDNAHQAREWFGEMGSRILHDADLADPVILVPIPNSECTMGIQHSRTAALARAIRERSDQVPEEGVADVLRWDEPMPSASGQNGPRAPAVLYPHLRLQPTPHRRQGTHVLVDDVWTTGGHIRACAAFLSRQGIVAEFAVCAARSDPTPQDDPFQERVDELPDFVPA